MKFCHRILPGVAAALLSTSCTDAPDEAAPGGGGDGGPTDGIPAGLTCANVHAIDEAHATLAAALAMAAPGDCVRVDEDAAVNLDVPAGVHLFARDGATTPTLTAADAAGAVVTLRPGASIHGLTIRGGAVGVFVVDGPAELTGTLVTDVDGTALYASCEAEVCRGSDALVQLHGVTLRASELGLWAHGANLRMHGGAIADCDSTSLVGGYGAVASHGAKLSLEGTELTGNEEVGLLVDGEGGTTAALVDAVVQDNLGRGVWAQGLRGTAEAPALSVSGAGGRIDGNHLAGLGAVDSHGIIVLDGFIGRTIAVEVPIDVSTTERIGDGVGLFAGTGDVRIERTELAASARTQLLVDQGAAGIIVLDGRVNPEGGLYGVVVQHTNSANEPTGVDIQRPRDAMPVVDAALGLGPVP